MRPVPYVGLLNPIVALILLCRCFVWEVVNDVHFDVTVISCTGSPAGGKMSLPAKISGTPPSIRTRSLSRIRAGRWVPSTPVDVHRMWLPVGLAVAGVYCPESRSTAGCVWRAGLPALIDPGYACELMLYSPPTFSGCYTATHLPTADLLLSLVSVLALPSDRHHRH